MHLQLKHLAAYQQSPRLLVVTPSDDHAVRIFDEEGKEQQENLAGIWT